MHMTTLTYGLRLHHTQMRLKLFVKREVILCAGAINTLQILMVSKIGERCETKTLANCKYSMVFFYHPSSSIHIFRSKDSVAAVSSPTRPFSLDPFCTNVCSLPLVSFEVVSVSAQRVNCVTFLRLDATGLAEFYFLKTSQLTSSSEPWGSNLSSLSDAPVRDKTSGPDAPDIELVSFPATYFHADSILVKPVADRQSLKEILISMKKPGNMMKRRILATYSSQA
ncbi:uncharacterized protein EI90DRAFT_2434014 [Cantharellus anzutake]|uniref:uncharacterized protein n=1 Tax=Cantharellus anzutake TaxID=1750568 RepID=UPI001906DEAF|nr:uncharacterized protein EI90DRAFT_2434014 [Cantharellus anzutake]KAF8338951.1 hypothetical protein EI90DRAFT_2434014 [Cantharellus anzutake]